MDKRIALIPYTWYSHTKNSEYPLIPKAQTEGQRSVSFNDAVNCYVYTASMIDELHTVPVLQTGRQGFSSRHRQRLFTSYPRLYWLLNLQNFLSNGHKLIYYYPHSPLPQLAGPYIWPLTTTQRQTYVWMEFYILSPMPRTTKTLVRSHAYPCQVCGGRRLSPITALPTAKPRIMWLGPLR